MVFLLLVQLPLAMKDCVYGVFTGETPRLQTPASETAFIDFSLRHAKSEYKYNIECGSSDTMWG